MPAPCAAQYDYRFAYTTSEAVLSKFKYKSAAVVFKPPRFVNEKFDKPKARFPGTNYSNTEALKIFLREASLPLVGQLTYNTKERYSARGIPLVKVFFDVDYALNPKGSNYYVNRVRKVAAEYVGKLSFAIAAIKDYSWEVRPRARARARERSPRLTRSRPAAHGCLLARARACAVV